MPRTPATTIRKIRVVGHTSRPWVTSWTLWAPLGLLVLGSFAGWLFWPVGQEQTLPQRRIEDFTFRWLCANGHAFTAKGSVGAKCTTCGADAHALDAYVCREHGVFEVELDFDSNPADPSRPHARRYRPAGAEGEWILLEKGVTCPKCGRIANRFEDDPLAHRKPHGGE